MFKKFAVLVALLVALPAYAEFTSQEKTETLKLPSAMENYGSVLTNLAQIARNPANGFHGANKTAFVQGVERLKAAHLQCINSLSYLSNVVPTVAAVPPLLASRQAYVNAAFSGFTSCRNELLNARAQIATLQAALPQASWASVTVPFDAAISALDSFSRNEAYANPAPLAFPAIVIPHGDYTQAIHSLWRSAFYLHDQPLGNEVREFGAVPVISDLAMREWADYLSSLGSAIKLHHKVWMMDLNIYSQAELDLILADRAAGGGTRPLDFWRLTRQIELLGTRFPAASPRMVSGRALTPGETGSLAQMGLHLALWWHEVLIANRLDAVALDASALGVWTTVQDFTDGWADFDHVFEMYIGLFHGFPSGPPGGISCGPGTHQEGSQCLPDEAACPTFAADYTVVDQGGSALVTPRCVVQ